MYYLEAVLVLHWHLIPDDQIYLSELRSQHALLLNAAYRPLEQFNRYLKLRV